MKTQFFDSSFFAGNRARLCQLFSGTAPIVITANGLLQQGGDTTFPFYQDRNFWYLTGLDEPNLILVMDKGKDYLIVPEREEAREKFDGALDFAQMSQISGIEDLTYAKEGWKRLRSRIKKAQTVATIAPPPSFIDLYEMYTNPARAVLLGKIKDVNPNVEILDLRDHLARLRVVKQAPELLAIQKAIDITLASIKDAVRPGKLAKYTHEYEIEAEITRGFRKRGASGNAYEPIVAAGENACTVHYMANDTELGENDLLLLDVGARVSNYAADISRTIAINGRPTKRQQKVFEAVKQVQEFAISLLKPGVKIRDYEKQIEKFMGEKLRELGLIKTIKSEAVRKYFPHATSHFLGLDVHDIGNYDWPLEPGVVLTVEPGIYIPEEKIGVRLEDNILITEDGCKVLSAALPRSLQ